MMMMQMIHDILSFLYRKQRLLSEFILQIGEYFRVMRLLFKHWQYIKENKKTSNIEKWKWFPHCNCCLQASCWKSITRPSTRGICLTGQKLPQRTSTQVVEIKHFSWEVKPPPPLSSHSTKGSSSPGRCWRPPLFYKSLVEPPFQQPRLNRVWLV